jgi:hypothetical protein
VCLLNNIKCVFQSSCNFAAHNVNVMNMDYGVTQLFSFFFFLGGGGASIDLHVCEIKQDGHYSSFYWDCVDLFR